MTKNGVKISLVVATYNRGEQLLRTLNSIVTQTLPRHKWEAIIVNNNSTDNTEQVFKHFMSGNPGFNNISLVLEKKQGLSYARNRGIKESVGEYVAMIDDDEVANEEFLSGYVELFDSYPDAMAAGGGIQPVYDYTPPKWVSKYTERPITAMIDKGGRVMKFRGDSYPIGGNMAFRRSVFEQLGGFNVALGRTGTKLLAGEEKDLFRRIKSSGGAIYWTPTPQILHIIPESRFSREYFSSLTKMIGVSERVRTKSISNWEYAKRLSSEVIKWCGVAVYSLIYLVKFQPSKAHYLLMMRWNITRGLIGAFD